MKQSFDTLLYRDRASLPSVLRVRRNVQLICRDWSAFCPGSGGCPIKTQFIMHELLHYKALQGSSGRAGIFQVLKHEQQGLSGRPATVSLPVLELLLAAGPEREITRRRASSRLN